MSRGALPADQRAQYGGETRLDRIRDVTPLAYLNWIQRGGTNDWKHLYALCKDPVVARAVAGVLALRDSDLLASARLWKFLLEDLHPGLELSIQLHEQPGEARPGQNCIYFHFTDC